ARHSTAFINAFYVICCEAFRILEIGELARRACQAERATTMSLIASKAAHELRNPLVSIEYAMQRLMDNEVGTPARIRLATLCKQEVQRVQLLANSLVGLGAPAPEAPAVCNLGTLIAEVLELMTPRAKDGGIGLYADAPKELFIVTDTKAMKQVLINLVGNAITALWKMEKRAGESLAIQVRCQVSAEQVEIYIKDNGPGIPAEMRDHLFTPYLREKGKGDGAGLGLMICKELSARLGGKLEVDNINYQGPERGTTFKLTLPMALAA
ncbi:MAG: HAMP domain-containing histidine kinase, partial [Opitutae bacterium]|nr:HAMP domain-containing histidine kinase [Opitutae bacterium]